MLGMKKNQLICALLLAACVWAGFSPGTAVLAAPENRYLLGGVDNAAEFEKTFSALQAALTANDRGKVADLVLYPLRVNGWLGDAAGKTTVQFSTPPEVVENFDDIFTSQIKEAIIKQKAEKMFVNWQGVMVGNGEVWLSGSGKTPARYGIIAVNLGTEVR